MAVAADPRTTGGMDMYNLAAGPIILVNPMESATVFQSTGYFTTEDGERHPTYSSSFNCLAQVQQLTVRDLMHLEQLNVQGSERKIYIYPSAGTTGVMPIAAVNRDAQMGGDIIHLADQTDWLVTSVLEQWIHPGTTVVNWICVSVTQQIKPAEPLQPPEPPEPPKPKPKPDRQDLLELFKMLMADAARTHRKLKRIERGEF